MGHRKSLKEKKHLEQKVCLQLVSMPLDADSKHIGQLMKSRILFYTVFFFHCLTTRRMYAIGNLFGTTIQDKVDEEWCLLEAALASFPENLGWVFLGRNTTEMKEDIDEIMIELNADVFFDEIGKSFKNSIIKVVKQFSIDFPRSAAFVEKTKIKDEHNMKSLISKHARTHTEAVKMLMLLTQASMASPLIILRDMIDSSLHVVECEDKCPLVAIVDPGNSYLPALCITLIKRLRVINSELDRTLCIIKIALKFDIVNDGVITVSYCIDPTEHYQNIWKNTDTSPRLS